MNAAYEARREGAEVAERLGADSQVRWFEAPLIDHRYRVGQWAEAAAAANRYSGVVESRSALYNDWQAYGIRAELRLAAGDLPGAVADVEHALELARGIDDVQSVFFMVPLAAHVFVGASERDRGAALLDELVESLRSGVDMQFAVINLPLVASAATRLGRCGELADALAAHVQSRWTKVVDAYAREEFAAAAEELRVIGSKPDEAEARLFAARSLVDAGRRTEADEQLALALEFYRRVDASRLVGECESLLAASA
jgi:tetratricopeptide (TPR) repeat protein